MVNETYVLTGHTLADDLGVLVDEDEGLRLCCVGEAARGERASCEHGGRALHQAPGEH